MKFSTILCFSAIVQGLQASANFKSTCSIASNQMASLFKSIGQIKATALTLGHQDIKSKCDEALDHLNFAQSSWQGISSGFLNQPWNARKSSHASIVKGRLSSCSGSLEWIYRCPRFKHPLYQKPGQSCRNNYNGCQSTCQQIWDWPSPPNNGPKPSGSYGGGGGYGGGYGGGFGGGFGGNFVGIHRRNNQHASLCPLSETACLISNSTRSVECLDTQNEITSCGGCVSEGQGENCLSIPGAVGVGCQSGKCIVLSVASGYAINDDGRPVAV